MAGQYYEGLGRRKAATARVRITPGGTGKFIVNERPVEEYLPRPNDYELVTVPLVVVGQLKTYDISVHVSGGGVSGQRDAIRLGISRALVKMDPDLKSALRAEDLMTRDAREKERKKPGLKRARKAPTFTKR